ncbi:glycosyltransferase family 2 protein [Nitrosovibrio sp. Nv17]|uniref:glycosyltransferase family 2 protein n=1 Tax=Nitrosovibrio sp. Nv17 TaxID=1855339 RepID=UPI000908D1DE|nr:glycosyltransferase family 2 protein [Nitrosovibrio sp. Nv17]SFW40485.1 Glycosyl transferase family 2 [Nitrosovibrio sp. Nv17]
MNPDTIRYSQTAWSKARDEIDAMPWSQWIFRCFTLMNRFSPSRLAICWKMLWAYFVSGARSLTTHSLPVRTTLITMVRNERDILEAFCAHALSLFDRIILVDHLSSDGTREYIRLLSDSHPKVECYFFDEPGYYQSELMTYVAQNLVDREMPGWVFFLDADEFLPFRSREAFDSRLAELAAFPVISMPWLNLIPLDMECGKIEDQLFLGPPRPSRHRKIAFQPSRVPPADYFIAQGNHALFLGDRSTKIGLPARSGFPLYHLPIRTRRQLHSKILCGIESYRNMGGDRRGKNGIHWDEIYRIMETSSLTDELMAGITVQYGDVLYPPYERNLDELRRNGYRELRMEIGAVRPGITFPGMEGAGPGNDTPDAGDAPGMPLQSASGYRIDFDRSIHSMRVVECLVPGNLCLRESGIAPPAP